MDVLDGGFGGMDRSLVVDVGRRVEWLSDVDGGQTDHQDNSNGRMICHHHIKRNRHQPRRLASDIHRVYLHQCCD